MPGLLGVSKEKEINAFKEYFKNPDFKPDMLKVYPCMVLKGTKLYDLWRKGKYKPLNTEEAACLMIELKKYVPRYVRISRLQRDIPTFMTEAGVDLTNFRQHVHELLKEKNLAGEVVENGRKKFFPKDVKNLENNLKNKLDLVDLLDEEMAEYKLKYSSGIKLYKGKKKIQRLFIERMKRQISGDDR